MAAITAADIETRRRALMTDTRCSVIVALPGATSDATAGVFLVKDPDPATDANTVADEAGNAKNGYKAFSYADVGTAYGL